MVEEKNVNNFNSIDLFKLIMAVAVVAIHTNPIVKWTNPAAIRIIVTIEEWTVTFFFAASGFFLFNNMNRPYKENTQRIDNYLCKIIKMYCAWTLFSLPLTVYGYVISGNGIISCFFSYIKYFLFVGKLYNSYHLWYLLALIYALVAIRFLVKKGFKPVYIFITALAVYVACEIFNVVGDNEELFGETVKKVVHLYKYVFNNGGVFTGMIYVSIGMMAAHYKLRINKYAGIAAVIAVNVLKLFVPEAVAHIIMPVEILVLFLALLEIKLPDCQAWIMCRKISTVVYLSHLIFFSIYTILIVNDPNRLGFGSFLITLSLSVLNSVLLINLSEKDKFRFIRHVI